MDIANLQAFVAVAKHGSFSQASESLFLTQPAISKRIAVLESELDALLFDRIGRNITLTETGNALLPKAKLILAEVEDSRRAIINLSGKVSGQLRIGTSHHIGLHRLPPVLRSYSKAYPQVELDLHFLGSETVCQSVLHGELELGVVTLPLISINDLQTRTIWPDPMDIVISKRHPLAKCKGVTPEQLSEHTAILTSEGTYTRETIELVFAPLGLNLKVRMATDYLETIMMMVNVGLGWSVLPRTMINKQLHVIQIKGVKLQRELGIVWHTKRTLSNAARAMIEELGACRT